MAAPKGNQFWKARSSYGRQPKFKTPAILLKACLEYFDWVESNPLMERKVFASKGDLLETDVPKMRAMTITGLCVFLDITFQTWENYKERKAYFEVVTRVEEIIKTQKFEGAAAEFLNPNIIARDLGLADKKDFSGGLFNLLINTGGENGKSGK